MKPRILLAALAAGLGSALALGVAVARGRPPAEPVPTVPQARFWHAFSGNGALDSASSRLYLFGGATADGSVLTGDLWSYDALADTWTLVALTSRSRPSYRRSAPLSCGEGLCVTAGGTTGASWVRETWIFTEATAAWWKMNCKRFFCPTPGMGPAMAFDPVNGHHVMFGGISGLFAALSDTYTYDTNTRLWTVRSPTHVPAARTFAAAAYVPGVGVTLFGGADWSVPTVLCDMFVWTGSDWAAVSYDAGLAPPCLTEHSIAAVGTGGRLLVSGGYSGNSSSPANYNHQRWLFTFNADGRSGTWSAVSGLTCAPVGEPIDEVVHAGAKMAFDFPTGTQVYFGGIEKVDGVGEVAYGNTVECY